MAYNIDTSKVTVPEALEILADAVLNPKFQSWEVADQVQLFYRIFTRRPVYLARLLSYSSTLVGVQAYFIPAWLCCV